MSIKKITSKPKNKINKSNKKNGQACRVNKNKKKESGNACQVKSKKQRPAGKKRKKV